MKKEKEIDEVQYVAEVAASIVNEVFNLVQDEAKKRGTNFGDSLALSIVRNSIFVMVFDSLTNLVIPENTTPEEAQSMIKANYAIMKDNLQNAIADGFEAASQKYSGQSLGYYCKVSTAGQPINNMPI